MKMKITREELEIRIKRSLDNFFNYQYTPGEILREQTEYHYLIRDLKTFKKQGGDVVNFKDTFLIGLFDRYKLLDEQEDFINDIIDIINGNCPKHSLL